MDVVRIEVLIRPVLQQGIDELQVTLVQRG